MELYKKYRPKTFEEVIGNEEVTSMLKSYIDTETLPHTLLLTGESGIGKTTIARIIARSLGIPEAEIEQSEFNMSSKETRGIEGIANITEDINFLSLTSPKKIYIFDEADQITPDAQKMLKKILEDTPKHVYFILCTTKPEKLVKDIKTRATEIALNPIDKRKMGKYLRDVAEKEGSEISASFSTAIATKANGSMRKAMVILDQVLSVDEAERESLLDTIIVDNKEATENLAKLLLNNPSWHVVKEAIKKIKEEPEAIRYGILGYCNAVLLGDNPYNYERASLIINTFSDSYIYLGKAGLTRDCFDVCNCG